MARDVVEEFRARTSHLREVLKQRLKQLQQRCRRKIRKAFLSEPDRSLSRFRETLNGVLITGTLHGVPVQGAHVEVSAVPLMDGGSLEGVILSTRGCETTEPTGTTAVSADLPTEGISFRARPEPFAVSQDVEWSVDHSDAAWSASRRCL